MVIETKKRTVTKTISWRVVAILNSWIVLVLSTTQSNFLNAIYMNITGFFVFYIFERIWSTIHWERYYE